MRTPDTKAGEVTERIMARIKKLRPDIPTHEYNLIYGQVLLELSEQNFRMDEEERREFARSLGWDNDPTGSTHIPIAKPSNEKS